MERHKSNFANEIKKAAIKEGLTYWEYIEKYQENRRLFPDRFRYIKADNKYKEVKINER